MSPRTTALTLPHVSPPMAELDGGPLPVHERVLRLRAYVLTFGSLAEAADALGVRPGTLRRNLHVELATAGALDVIEEGCPGGCPPGAV